MGRPLKIAILLPVHGMTRAGFTLSLARMIAFTCRAQVDSPVGKLEPHIETFMVSTSNIGHSRRMLARQALEWGADYVLWADSDHEFPRDALLRLLAHGKPVVGVNYRRRDPATEIPTAARLLPGGGTEPVPPKVEGLEQVAHLGLGLCAMEARVLASVPEPRFRESVSPEGLLRGEDVDFFDALAELGVPVFLDHALSLEVGHFAEVSLRFASPA